MAVAAASWPRPELYASFMLICMGVGAGDGVCVCWPGLGMCVLLFYKQF